MSDTQTGTRRVAIITGASDGIGAELARLMAKKDHDLALVARRRERLDALAREVAGAGRPSPLVIPLDLAAANAPDALAQALRDAGAEPQILVNNAGFGLQGQVAELDPAEQLKMIDLNVRALTALTLKFLPELIAARGRILNVASVAAFLPGPGMAVYYATKAYVLSFSEALSQELSGKGVSVTALCPGPVPTGFQAAAGMTANLTGLMKMAETSPQAVADAAYRGMMSGRRVVMPSLADWMSASAAALTPRSLLLPMIGRVQGAR
ncbi:MAG: SDR family oxidoreductase [Methylobacteriaceae bacterium]|nr:SDR family oxidoreductase [Methylobacteriaceae bacterium]